jgi:hypothetical protein
MYGPDPWRMVNGFKDAREIYLWNGCFRKPVMLWKNDACELYVNHGRFKLKRC